MPRGRYSLSRTADLNVSIDFELFSSDEMGNKKLPTSVTVNQITNYTFDDAIENFEGTFDEQGFDSFEFVSELKVEDLTLDLIARDIPKNTLLTLADGRPTIDSSDDNTIDIDNDRIEYIFSSSELEAKGISEVALFVEDFDTLKDVQSNLILDTEEERLAATTDIDSILNVINSAALTTDAGTQEPSLNIRVSGKSANSDRIVSSENVSDQIPQQVILEAEDLNNLGDYKVVNFPAVGGEVISLLSADRKTSVATATATSGELNLGNLDQNKDGKYDVEISYFDENDGKGQIDILLNRSNGDVETVGTIELDEPTSCGLPNEHIRRSFVIQDLDILTGDTISIRGTADKGEQARVDYIGFYDDDEFIADTTSEL